MNTSSADNDTTGLEALQAQIDLSMSFAQDMVSSWVKLPRKLPSRRRDTEAELKEYTTRPPRLGVGAPIPRTHNFSREAARLKGQLTEKGGKSSKTEESGIKQPEEEEDNEESRSGAITKKTRVDPFGDNRAKKKAKKDLSLPPESRTLGNPTPKKLTEAKVPEQAEVKLDINKVSISSPTPHRATPQERKHSISKPTVTSVIQGDHMSASSLKMHTPKCTTSAPEEPIEISTTLELADISPMQIPILPSNNHRLMQPVALLNYPLLNLAPPTSDNDTPSTPSQKKKRKRRKKKRNATLVTATTDGLI